MSRPIIPIRRAKHRPALRPTTRTRRIATALVRQQAKLVRRAPALAAAVRDVRLAAVVQRRGALGYGEVALRFPGLGRFGEEGGGAEGRGRGHGRDAERLQRVADAGVDVVVLVGEAEDGAVDGPFGEELGGEGVGVPGGGAACGRGMVVSGLLLWVFFSDCLIGFGVYEPLRTNDLCPSRLTLLPAV